MLIQKLPARKISPLPPFLRKLVLQIYEADDSQLPEILKHIVDVSLPKSDLNNWIGVINKFDQILEGLISKYNLTTIQKIDFSPTDKEILLSVLSLTKSLFDKCTNRNLYCSYERLNDLLNSNDLDVIEMVLSAIMRPAQRVNAQRSVRVNFLISQDRISTLCNTWGLTDPKLTLSDISSPSFSFKKEPFHVDILHSHLDPKPSTKEQSSSKVTPKKEKNSNSEPTESFQTTIHVNDIFSKGNNVSDIFYKLVEEYQVPEEHYYFLFQKVRIALAISNPEQRVKLLSIRLLALSVFCYVASETLAVRSVFIYEPSLITNLASLLHPDSDAPLCIQAAAIHSLDSIAHFPAKMNEVLGAIGASTNHGVLLYVLKRVISLEDLDDSRFLPLIDSLFSFLGYIFTSQSGGTMLVSAGIVSLLVSFISSDMVKSPIRLRYKGIQLMDNAIFGFPTAFGSFQSSNGLTVLVQRIKEQVETCLSLNIENSNDVSEMTTNIILIENLILLKGLVKFVLHMLQASNTGVGLRNLVDTSLPNSLKIMFENSELFSPMVYGQAVNIMATIIHNEPTSLAILQEQKLPQTFLHTVAQGFPAAAEALYPICNSFGAICLNNAGLDLLIELKIMDRFFEIFTSPDHVYVLEEPEVLTLLGSAFDELTRHHPSIKDSVIDNVIKTLETFLKMGNEGFSSWAEEAQFHMDKNNQESLAIHLMSVIDKTSDKPDYGSVYKNEVPELFLVRFIDSYFKFLEGFFQNSSHVDLFREKHGYEKLLEFYSLPAMPCEFPSLKVASSLAQVLRSANEASIEPIMSAVMTKLTSILTEAESWMNYSGEGLFDLSSGDLSEDDPLTRAVCIQGKALYGLCDVLFGFSDPTLFTQSNVGTTLIQTIIKFGPDLISRLGHFLRVAQWEIIRFKEFKLVSETSDTDSTLKFSSPMIKNIYQIFGQTSGHISDFFQGLVKISMTRRTMTLASKRDSKLVLMEVANQIREYFLWEKIDPTFNTSTIKYITNGFMFLTLQLLDRRHQMFIHLLMLMCFEKINGFDLFFSKMTQLWECFQNLPYENTVQLNSIKKCLEVGFSLMEYLCNHRFYSDCPYISNILPGTNLSPSTDPSYPNDYLSKYRMRIALFLQTVWQSHNINRLSKTHVRTIVSTFCFIIKGQALRHDVAQRPRTTHPGALAGLLALRRPDPEQERVQQLVDMGFPRNASETALVRFGNNMSRAAEYLLTHPEVVAAASFDNNPPENTSNPPTTQSENPDQATSNTVEENNMGSESQEKPSAPSENNEEVLFVKDDIVELPESESLDKIRLELKTSLLPSVFSVLDGIPGSVFCLRDLLSLLIKSSPDPKIVLERISSELETHISYISKAEELARRFRLLGFLLLDESVAKAVIPLATTIFSQTTNLIAEGIDNQNVDASFLSTALIIVEIVHMYADEPRADKLEHPLSAANTIITQEPTSSEAIQISSDERNLLTKSCIKLLYHKVADNPDVLIAIVRLLVRLTRHEEQALFFADQNGLSALFWHLSTDINRFQGQHIHIIIIIRHVIETQAVLQDAFESQIYRWLTANKSRSTEIVSFIKHNAHLVLRHPQIFVEATSRKCKINRYDPDGRMPQISLIESKLPTSEDSKTIDNEPSNQIPTLEDKGVSIMHYLISEILSSREETLQVESMEISSKDNPDPASAADLYQIMLLQCLTELFYCFPSCRIEFLASKTKTSGVTQTNPPSRSLFINYLLNDLLPYRTTNPKQATSATSVDNSKSAWAASLLSSFLIGHNDVLIDSKTYDLAPMRKFVLDLIYRSFQEVTHLPKNVNRFGKLTALSDLCFKILSVKKGPSETAIRSDEEVNISIAKIMLEKHFVPLFISILNSIDLGLPSLKNTINSLLRPLEVLSKLAIKLGHKVNSTDPDRMDSDHSMGEELSESSEDEAAEVFLRSSALGVIDGSTIEDQDESIHDNEEMQDEFGYSSEASEESSQSENDVIDIGQSEYESDMDSQGSNNDYSSEDTQEDQPSDWHSSDFDGDDNPEEISPQDPDENEVIGDIHVPSDEDDVLDEDEDMEDVEEMDVDEGAFDDVFEGIYQGTLEINSDSIGAPGILRGDDFEELNFRSGNNNGRFFSFSGRGFQFGNNSVHPWSVERDQGILDPPGFSDHPSRRIFNAQDVTVHPLLSNDNALVSIPPPLLNSFGNTGSQSLQTTLGISATRLLSHIFSRVSPSGAHVNRLPSLLGDTSQGGATLDITAVVNSEGGLQFTTDSTGAENIPKTVVSDFTLMYSNERWLQEARMMFGNSFSEHAVYILAAILNQLIPRALKERKDQEEANSQLLEASEASENQEPAEDSIIQREDLDDNSMDIHSTQINPEVIADDVPEEMEVDPIPATVDTPPTPHNEVAQEPEVAQVENVDETVTPITITIYGQSVDITNTGIDPTFLEALPDDLRQEVINQHFQENPPPVQVPENTSISEEFLNAIPPELREEVLMHERHQQEALNRPAEERTGSLSALGIFSDNAQEAERVAHSPNSHQIDDVSGDRQSALQMRIDTNRMFSGIRNLARLTRTQDLINRITERGNPSKSHCQAVQVVDRQELAILLRLIFLPQVTGKHLIHRILLNLSENSKTCSDLIMLLITIMQDGADDLSSVDRSFANLSFRTKPPPPVYKSFNQAVPNLITQRCLEALSYLFSTNDYSIRLCLKELEGLGSRRITKKSKSREKNTSRYPIIALLSMLDRPNFSKNHHLMDLIMQQLSAITKVLSSLIKHSETRAKISSVKDDQIEQPTGSSSGSVLPSSSKDDPESTKEPKQKPPTFKPPPIPDTCLNSIVNILASGECSNKTFQYALSTIQYLLTISGTEATFSSELIQRSKQISLNILNDLNQIKSRLSYDMGNEGLQNLILTSFSPASSSQSRLLRLLKTLDFMITRKLAAVIKEKDPKTETPLDSTPPKLYQELNTLELWDRLSDTLGLIQEQPVLIHVATVLLPLIEAFMVICKHSGSIQTANSRGSVPPEGSKSDSDQENNLFFQFTEKHRKLLNVIIRNNPSLMSGTFELLIKNHKVLDFDNKRNYFNQQLHKRNSSRDYHSTLQLNVRRQNVFEDSFRQFQGRSGQEIKHGKLNVKFHEEEGVDAGGVTREWFSVLAKQMFNPDYALFKSSANDRITYQPNRTSWVNSDHLLYFKFVGRIIGKAIYDDFVFDAYFTRSFYKHILGKVVEIRDLEALDPEFYKSMVWMLENDITDVVYANFCVETDDFGKSQIIELKPGGQNIAVTQENKFEYVQLISEQKLYGAIKDQIEHFLRGFHEIIPKDLISIFNEQELELLISGLPDIDIDDWKNNTDYEGYTASSPQIQWFWRAVRSFDQSERAKLLQFVTGTSKVPLEGFGHLQGSTGKQKFQIHRDFASVKRLPSAHTCFNQLDVPMYESYEDLRRQLLLAIEECNTGFGFG